jgi:hypothetical protein
VRAALRLLAAAFASLLLLPPAAGAKGVLSVQVCGGDECTRVRDGVLPAPGALAGPQVLDPPRREPFAHVVTEIGHEGTVVARDWARFLPRAGLLQADNGGWIVPDGAAVAALRRIVRELELMPAARLRMLEAPAPPPPAPVAAAPRVPGWLSPATAALLVALALVPLARLRRAPAG